MDHCTVGPCLNGGTCTSLDVGYECSCVPGYNGTNCELGEIIHDLLTWPILSKAECLVLDFYRRQEVLRSVVFVGVFVR